MKANSEPSTDKTLDRDCTTLSRHVLQQMESFDSQAQDLSALMNRYRDWETDRKSTRLNSSH